MGFFGMFAYSDGEWVGEEPTGEPSLVIDIHDSDIATIEYAPATGVGGRFYLGVEPRLYFDDDEASAPVNTAAEARGFADWVRQVQGHDVDPGAIQELMAVADEEAEPADDFVEETVEKLLVLIGLPLPEGLTASGTRSRGWRSVRVALGEGGAVASVPDFMELAKAALAKDKSHATFAFLFREGESPVPVLGGYRNEEQKRHFFGEVLPDLVRRERVDGVLVVAEATRGGDDVLLVSAEQRDGQQAALLTPFAKKFPRRIVFGEATDEGGIETHLLDDVRAVWAEG